MNRLGGETSLYLRQHAGNPVHWQPWGAQAWEEARRLDRLVVVSIGYAACHWCHVMERETFEDAGAADVMNAHFVSIKVDREERPDVDQIYMAAVTLMTRQGGWPLNVICLPDGRPVYGGTYFPRAQWMEVLRLLVGLWRTERGRVLAYAERLAAGVAELGEGGMPAGGVGAWGASDWAPWVEEVRRWSGSWDGQWGGERRAPKFPMAGAWDFLLTYSNEMADGAARAQVRRTLLGMERGGIHDHVGGGFARYAVDDRWRVPHFEKMLCDQGLLLGLYARAWRVMPERAFFRAAEGIVRFVEGELGNGEGAFYASLDADSEGAEGRYYVVTEAEWTAALSDAGDRAWAEEVYDWRGEGVWEESVPGARVVMRWADDGDCARSMGMELAEWEGRRVRVEAALRAYRSANRVRPACDDKVLTAWNALMIEGLAQAGAILDRPEWVGQASRAGGFLLDRMRAPDGRFFRAYHPASGPRIPGFLDDHAYAAMAFLQLYQVTLEARWYVAARETVETALRVFTDAVSGAVHFAPSDTGTFARWQDLEDQAVPAANAVFARCLFLLGVLEDRPDWVERADGMLAGALPRVTSVPGGAQWLGLLSWRSRSFTFWGIVGGTPSERSAARNQWLRRYRGQGFLFGEPLTPAGQAAPPAPGPAGPAGPAWLATLIPDPAAPRPLRWHPCRPGACGLPLEADSVDWERV